jgi:iron complex outermembrane receptor protein
VPSFHSLPTWLAAASLLAAVPARAQTTAPDDVDIQLSRIVITASGVGSLSSRHLLTSVDTIGGADVQDAAVNNTWELLARLPGVELTNFNQGTTTGKVSLRGFNGEGEVNALKLLIDGVPSNSNDGNMPYLDLVTPLGLQAVTAVRGTNDARFGLHAIAGSLELLTRSGGNATDLRAGAGPWGKADAQLAVDREADGFSQNYALGVRHTDGWRDHAAADRSTASGQWAWAPAGHDMRVALALRAHRAKAQEPGYLQAEDAEADPRGAYATSATDGGERELGQASASIEGGQHQALSWRALAYLNRFKDQRWVRFSPDVSQQERDTDETHRGLRTLVSWRPRVDGLAELAIEGGADTEHQNNSSLRYNTTQRNRDSQTRDQHWRMDIDGVFVQAVLRPVPSLKLVPGWRADHIGGQFDNRLADARYGVNDYGWIRQPKFSAVWSPFDAFSTYANWGRTFQVGVGAASFKIPPRVADLAPSINDGVELGLKYRLDDLLQARLALWRQTATDEVWRDLNNPSGDSTNVGATRRRGVDLELRAHPAAALDAHASLSLQKAVITEPNPAAPDTRGRELDHVPRHLFNAGLDWQVLPRLKLAAWAQGQGSYWLERTNRLTGKFGGYRALNLGASWQASDALQWDLQLLNATDARREYVWWDGSKTLHSPGEPRALNLALRLSL